MLGDLLHIDVENTEFINVLLHNTNSFHYVSDVFTLMISSIDYYK